MRMCTVVHVCACVRVLVCFLFGCVCVLAGARVLFTRVGAQVKGGKFVEHRLSPLVFLNEGTYVGGVEEFIDWVERAHALRVTPNSVLYTRIANAA
jgi:hypothetical protein